MKPFVALVLVISIGAPLAADQRVNVPFLLSSDRAWRPRILAADGEWIVTWLETRNAFGHYTLSRFDLAGRRTFGPAEFDTGGRVVTNYEVAWGGSSIGGIYRGSRGVQYVVWFRTWDRDGASASPEIEVCPTCSYVAMLDIVFADNEFTVSYVPETSPKPQEIRIRRLSRDDRLQEPLHRDRLHSAGGAYPESDQSLLGGVASWKEHRHQDRLGGHGRRHHRACTRCPGAHGRDGLGPAMK